MATSALISVAEYLNTSYRPECDYVDGKVLSVIWANWNMRDRPIAAWFFAHQRE